jgi:hypothetical protein
MKNSVLKSIINNTFLPNYDAIYDYYVENNLVYNDHTQNDKVDGGFTLDFCPNDHKELFEQNLKTQPDDWYYRTHPVKYTLNSLGYRTREFDDIDWKESIVMFGCSFVFGIGVTDKHTIPYFLEQLSGRPVINMGIGASSIQTVLHNSIILNDSKYPTPKAVVNMRTDLNRYQLYENNLVFHNGEWNKSDDKFETIDNLIPFNLMNVKMIRNLWKNKTICYEGTLFSQANLINKLDKEIYCEFFERDDGLARDLSHNGPVKNLEIARGIYEELKPQLAN